MFNKLIVKVVLIQGLCGIALNGRCETPGVSCGDLNRNIAGQGAKMSVADSRGADDLKKNLAMVVAAISPARMLKLMADKAIGIIDTRSEKEFEIAHLPGAKNIQLEGFGAALAGLSKDTEWVVYDKQPENAKAAARQMAEKGFNAKELSGGIQVWSARKYPLETGAAK